MTILDRARLSLAAQEAALSMHRDNGDKIAARSAQARVNGLRTKVAKLAVEARALAEKRAWYGAAA
jgi:hypothetical protein